MRCRAQSGHAQRLAAEIGRGFDLPGLFFGDQQDFARGLGELHHRLHQFAPCLQVDGAVIETDHAVRNPRQHFPFGTAPRRRAEQLDFQPGFLQIAQAFGQHGRQINLLVNAANHDRDLFRGQPGRAGQQQEYQGHQSNYRVHRISIKIMRWQQILYPLADRFR